MFKSIAILLLLPAFSLASLIPRDGRIPALLRHATGGSATRALALEIRQSTCPDITDTLCSDGGGCCPIGTLCDVSDGQSGCCPFGETCSASGRSPCEVAGDALCAGDTFCCPTGEFCFRESGSDAPMCSTSPDGGGVSSPGSPIGSSGTSGSGSSSGGTSSSSSTSGATSKREFIGANIVIALAASFFAL
ncbi:hypothetical protein BD779DRAFT_1561468 [Infundibulicybe gibba]|nr:hypothetical protein BD779DRAFT_1561468 [Infundibulicybe gibba]